MYRLLTTEEQVRIACEDLSHQDAIGLDSETTALAPRKGELRLIQLSSPEMDYIIDMFKFPLSRGVLAPLKTLLESKVKKVLFNAKFDYQWIKEKAGIEIKTIFDAYLADLITSNMGSGIRSVTHSLESTVQRYLDESLSKEQQVSNWAGELSKSQLTYAARDSAILLPLREKLLKKIVQFGLEKIAKLEFECIPAVASIETNGFPIDEKMFHELYEFLKLRQIESSKALQKIVKRKGAAVQISMFEGINEKDYGELNLNSHIQIRKAFRDLGVPIFMPPTEKDGQITKENDLDLIKQFTQKRKPFAINTSFKEISPLAKLYPILEPLLEYRTIEQLCNTNCAPLIPMIENGRIYPSVWQINTETGRMSMSNPNLQQVPVAKEFTGITSIKFPDWIGIDGESYGPIYTIPDKNKTVINFRKCFIAETGTKLNIADYGQIELRILAQLSQDPVLLKVFRDGLDLHAMTQAGIFNQTYEYIIENKKKLPPENRIFAKTLNFGISYGMGAGSYAQRTGRPLKQAKEDVEKFRETYKVMTTYLKNLGDRGLKSLMTTTPLGRGWRLNPPSAINEEDRKAQEGAIRRNAANHPIQGSSADIIKLALKNVYDAIQGCDARIVHVVHDEIHVESSEKCAEEICEIMKREMIKAGELLITSIPVTVDEKACTNWGEKA